MDNGKLCCQRFTDVRMAKRNNCPNPNTVCANLSDALLYNLDIYAERYQMTRSALVRAMFASIS